jgi:hypothetical protein
MTWHKFRYLAYGAVACMWCAAGGGIIERSMWIGMAAVSIGAFMVAQLALEASREKS